MDTPILRPQRLAFPNSIPFARLLFVVFVFSLGMKSASHAEITPGSQNLGSIWFIGDSITQGGSDQDSTRTARSCLYNLLTAAGYTFDFTGHYTVNAEGMPTTGSTALTNLYAYHSGVGGSVIGNSTSDRNGITQSLPSWWNTGRLPAAKPNVILIMIGTNDVDTSLDLPNAPARLATLLDTIYALPGIGSPTILLASIPPNRVSSTRTTGVATFNAALPSLVKTYQDKGDDIYFVDQFTDLNNNFSTTMLAANNLHPNGTGDQTIAQNWFQALQALADLPQAPALAVRNPLADSFVRDGSYATANYGATSSLISKASYTGYSRQIYLKFDLSTLPAGTENVKLRLYGGRIPDGVVTTTTSESVSGAANENWTESTLTWNKRPAALPSKLSSATIAGQVTRWYDWDVSSYVLSRFAASSSTVTLVVAMDQQPAGDEGYDVFNSRSTGANQPQLVFSGSASTPTPTPTPVPTATPTPTPSGAILSTRAPIADSYVRDGSYATANYGTATTLIGKASYTSYTRQIYLKFDLSNVPATAQNVKLRLYGGRTPDGVVTTTTSESVSGTANETWTETAITWNKRPAPLSSPLSSVTVAGQTSQWYEWDVSSYVLSRSVAKSATVTLVVTMDQQPANDEGFDVFNSRNASSNKPQLVFSAP